MQEIKKGLIGLYPRVIYGTFGFAPVKKNSRLRPCKIKILQDCPPSPLSQQNLWHGNYMAFSFSFLFILWLTRVKNNLHVINNLKN